MSTQPSGDTTGLTRFAQGVVTGALLSSLNKHMLFGAMVGIAGGMFYQQEFGAPDVKSALGEVRRTISDIIDDQRKK